MKKAHFFGLLFILAFALILTFAIKNKFSVLVDSSSPSEKLEAKVIEPASRNQDGDRKADNQLESERKSEQVFDRLLFEMNKKICKEEQEELGRMFASPTVLPDASEIPDGLGVPMEESKTVLSAQQAVALLKKRSKSKCALFRKNNVDTLLNFKLDATNYKEFFLQEDLILSDNNWFSDYLLLKKSLAAMETATPQEKLLLREAIVESLKIEINAATEVSNLMGTMNAIKMITESGIVDKWQKSKVDMLERELTELWNDELAHSKQLNKKYLPADPKAIMKLSLDDMVSLYGYEGTRESLELKRRSYASMRAFVRKINDFEDTPGTD